MNSIGGKSKMTSGEAPMYFPLLINFYGKKVFIAGLGKVGRRRAQKLRDAGAVVTCADRRLKKLKGVQFYKKTLTQTNIPPLKNYFLVIAATNDRDLNEAIAKKARKAGVLVNRVDDFRGGDVIFPAAVKVGKNLFAFTTFGRRPSSSKKVIEVLRNVISTIEVEEA